MSHNQNTAFLDFPDQKRSLSFDSFYENGQQTIERPSFAGGMCICAEMANLGKLSIFWNGELYKEMTLPEGSHKLPLEDNIPAGEGELTLEAKGGPEAGPKRVYRLVSDYVMAYSEFQFRVYKEHRDAQRLKRLLMQCPAPHTGQTLASLSTDKYDAASKEVEQIARVLGNLHAIDLSHMFHITTSMGDSQDRRKDIDNALMHLSNRLHDAMRLLESTTLNVEHARYYADQDR